MSNHILLLRYRLHVLRALLVLRRLKRRRHWVHPIFAARATEGELEKLMPRLRSEPLKFQNYFRMTITAFDLLLGLVSDKYEHAPKMSIPKPFLGF